MALFRKFVQLACIALCPLVAVAADSWFAVTNAYRAAGVTTQVAPIKGLSAKEVTARVMQIKRLFPEIYAQLFTEPGQFKPGLGWPDYQRALQAHYAALLADARKLYGENSENYKHLTQEVAAEASMRRSDAVYSSNFQFPTIPANMLSTLNAAGVWTASQLRDYSPTLYEQYIGSKGLASDFYLGPLNALVGSPSRCRLEKPAKPLCPVGGGDGKTAAAAAGACAKARGDKGQALAIAKDVAQQIGAGTVEAAMILASVSANLQLNETERTELVNGFSVSACFTATKKILKSATESSLAALAVSESAETAQLSLVEPPRLGLTPEQSLLASPGGIPAIDVNTLLQTFQKEQPTSPK